MKLENAGKIAEYLRDTDVKVSLRPDYSGRGMFGMETTALVVSDPADVAEAMGALGIKDTRRVDNMGRDYVVY